MKIESSRFGTLKKVREETVLEFPDGLIGLARTSATRWSPSHKTRPRSTGSTGPTTRMLPSR